MDRNLTLALIQHKCTGKKTTNLERSTSGIRDAASRGANLVLLQELHTSLYFCQEESTNYFDLAESIPGPTTEILSTLAKELDIVIVSSLFEKRASGLYHNTAVVLDTDKGIVGTYRKMHIPDDPGYYEKFYFTPGDYQSDANDVALTGFRPIDTSVGKLGVLVCWDQWFPEAARLMALAGADILLYPTAIGWDKTDNQDEKNRQLDAWVTVQRAHAIANGLHVAACNRTGIEAAPGTHTEGIHFWGSSFITGPQGEILVRAPTDDEAMIMTSLDLTRSEEVRRAWPYLRDRRIDAYKDILKRYRD